MKTEELVLIGVAALAVYILLPSTPLGTSTGGGAIAGRRRSTIMGLTPRYSMQGGGLYYGQGLDSGGGISMHDSPPLIGVPTAPPLNNLAVGPTGAALKSYPGATQSEQDGINASFGPRPANWPPFAPWPTPLMKMQEVAKARAGIARILHPPKGASVTDPTAFVLAAGGGNERIGTGLGSFVVHE